MAQIVGYVKSVEGEFVAKSPDGSLRELKAGDPIYAGDLVYDPAHDVHHRIVIDLASSEQDLALDGKAEILFDTSVTSIEPFTMEETLSEADVSAALKEAKFEEGDSLDDLLKEYGDIDVDETAVGEEDVRPLSHSTGDLFFNQNNAMADVNADLRSVASHNYTLAQNDPFSPVGGESTTPLTTPETAPIYIPPVGVPETPPVPPIRPPRDTETSNQFHIVDPDNDGVINASESQAFRIAGTAEAGGSVAVTISDGEKTLQVPPSAVHYNPATGAFEISGVDISGLKDGVITVSVTNTDRVGNTATTTHTILKDATPPVAPTGELPQSSQEDTGVSDTDNITANTTPTLVGTAEAGSMVAVEIGGRTYTTTADNTGEWSVTITDALADGIYTPRITSTDAAGNRTTADGETFTVDTKAHAQNDAAFVKEDTSIDIDVLANDEVGSKILSVQVPTNASGQPLGTAEIVEVGGKQVVRFTPSEAYNALGENEKETFQLQYTVEDPAGNRASATVDIMVEGVNDAPTVSDEIVDANHGETVAFDLADNVSDVEDDAHGDMTKIRIDSLPVHGVLKADKDGDGQLETLSSGDTIDKTTSIVYETTAEPVLFGTKDDIGTLGQWGVENNGRLILDRNGIHGEVIATSDATVNRVGFDAGDIGSHDGTGIGVDSGKGDPNQIDLKNHEKLTIRFDDPVANGEVGFSGVGGWFRESDSHNGRAVWKAYLGDTLVAEGEARQDASDDRNPNTAVAHVDQPFDRIELTVEADKDSPNYSVQYIEVNPIEEDRFQYTAIDSEGKPSDTSATVAIQNTASGNFSPDAGNDSLKVKEDHSKTFSVDNLLANDIDGNGKETIRFDGIIEQPKHGTLTDNGNGTFTYTPDPDYDGTDRFEYRIVDDHGMADTATVEFKVKSDGRELEPTVTLSKHSDTGVSDSDRITNDDTPTLIGTTENGASITVSDETGRVVGTATADAHGRYTVTTDSLSEGQHTLTVTATSRSGESAETTLDLAIDKTPPAAPTIDFPEDRDSNGYITKNEYDGRIDVDITLPAGTKEGEILHLVHPDGSQSDIVVTDDMAREGHYKTAYTANDGDVLTVSAYLTDKAGNEGRVGSAEIKVDTTTDLTFVKETAGYRNVFGVYEVDADGNPIGGKVIIDDQNGLHPGEVLAELDPAKEYRFFVIANGANEVTKNSVITFDNSGEKPVMIADGKEIQHPVYYSDVPFNPDNGDHFDTVVDNQGNTTIYIEDLPKGSWDSDFQDIVLEAGIPVYDRAGEGDDIFFLEKGRHIDGKVGEDTLILHNNESIDLSLLGPETRIENIETINLGPNGDHEISNLTLDDVLEMTDDNNTLVIDGDRGDKVNVPDTPMGYSVEKTTDGGYDVYTYSSSTGDPTVILKIDQDVSHS